MARSTNPLSRKYYVMVANAIIEAYNTSDNDKREFLGSLIESLRYDFKRDNSRFDAERFDDYIMERIK